MWKILGLEMEVGVGVVVGENVNIAALTFLSIYILSLLLHQLSIIIVYNLFFIPITNIYHHHHHHHHSPSQTPSFHHQIPQHPSADLMKLHK